MTNLQSLLILTTHFQFFLFKPKQDPKMQDPKMKDPKMQDAAAAVEGGGKSKAELKAERRAKQEAQRAAKAAGEDKKEKAASSKPKAQRVPDDMQVGKIEIQGDTSGRTKPHVDIKTKVPF